MAHIAHTSSSLRLRSRQVNLLLGLVVLAEVATGLGSWIVGDRWSGSFTTAHGVLGFALLLLIPAKLRGPVAAGFRRRRQTRWLSAAFGVLVLVVVALGLLHATGLWYGVGAWTPLWTHTALVVAVVPLLAWHLLTRPVRPRPADLDRRAFLTGGLALGAAGVIYAAQQGVTRLGGLAVDRRFTGSREVGSHDSEGMPSVIWFDDTQPSDLDAGSWPLVIDGQPTSIEALRVRARPVVAVLDCTGGWWSEQSWDAVPLSELVRSRAGRSVRVRSATGYDRRFAYDDLDDVYLAIGYGGAPLRPGHGAPVRLVAPGRRGPWWVKWVTSVEPDDRPPWLQPPLPLT